MNLPHSWDTWVPTCKWHLSDQWSNMFKSWNFVVNVHFKLNERSLCFEFVNAYKALHEWIEFERARIYWVEFELTKLGLNSTYVHSCSPQKLKFSTGAIQNLFHKESLYWNLKPNFIWRRRSKPYVSPITISQPATSAPFGRGIDSGILSTT